MRELNMLQDLIDKIKTADYIYDCFYYQELETRELEDGKIYCAIDPIKKSSNALKSSKQETIILHFIIKAIDGFKSLLVIDEVVEGKLKENILSEYIRGIEMDNSGSPYYDKYYGYVRDLNIKINWK